MINKTKDKILLNFLNILNKNNKKVYKIKNDSINLYKSKLKKEGKIYLNENQDVFIILTNNSKIVNDEIDNRIIVGENLEVPNFNVNLEDVTSVSNSKRIENEDRFKNDLNNLKEGIKYSHLYRSKEDIKQIEEYLTRYRFNIDNNLKMVETKVKEIINFAYSKKETSKNNGFPSINREDVLLINRYFSDILSISEHTANLSLSRRYKKIHNKKPERTFDKLFELMSIEIETIKKERKNEDFWKPDYLKSDYKYPEMS